MGRNKQPLVLLEAKGAKHLTKQEKQARSETELKAPIPDSVEPPQWLKEGLHSDFYSLSQKLIELGIFSELDCDVLGMYLTTRSQWERATELVNAELRKGQDADQKALSAYSSIQASFFRQARSCASDMGLSITSRCKLVLPKTEQEEVDPMEELMTA